MKHFLTVLLLIPFSMSLMAQSCQQLKTAFEKEEGAYTQVARVAIAGNSAYKIIGQFIASGERVLKECPKSYSLDRQYTLKRKLAKAKRYQQSYAVMSQSQLSSYARSHPEEIVVYKWGTVKLTP